MQTKRRGYSPLFNVTYKIFIIPTMSTGWSLPILWTKSVSIIRIRFDVLTVGYLCIPAIISFFMRIPPLLYFLILYHILWKYPHNTPLSAIIINSNIFIHRKNQVHKVLGHLLKSVATIQPGYNFP